MSDYPNNVALDPDTPCPHRESGTIRPPGVIPIFTLRPSSCEIKRCYTCGGNHTPKHFKETHPVIYAEINRQRQEKLHGPDTESVESESHVDESNTLEECDQAIFSLSTQYNSLCDKIADAFQHKVDCSPRLTGKTPLASLKLILWRYHHKDVNKTHCPCCNVSEISHDIYVAGHIHPESRGGSSSIDNLLPICVNCNSRMGTQHLYAYTWKTFKRALWS